MLRGAGFGAACQHLPPQAGGEEPVPEAGRRRPRRRPTPPSGARTCPAQFDTYQRTADTTRTRFGGSEAMPEQKIDRDPWLRRMFSGYAFSIDYRDRRGHAYMLIDQEQTRARDQEAAARRVPALSRRDHPDLSPARRRRRHEGLLSRSCGMTYQQAEVTRAEEDAGLASPGRRRARSAAHPVPASTATTRSNMELRVTRPASSSASQRWPKAAIRCRTCRASSAGGRQAARSRTTPIATQPGRRCDRSSAASATSSITAGRRRRCSSRGRTG